MVLKKTQDVFYIEPRVRTALFKTAYYLDNSNPLYKLHNLKLAGAPETQLGTISDILLLLSADDTFSLSDLLEIQPLLNQIIGTIANAVVEIRSSSQLMKEVDVKALSKSMFALVELERNIARVAAYQETENNS